MARRATTSTKGRNAAQEAVSSDRTEQGAAKAPRRSTKSKQRETPLEDTSVTDAFFPGGEEPIASTVTSEPAKARRVRKPRSIELAAEPLTPDDADAEEATAPSMQTEAVEQDERPAIAEAPDAAPSASLASADSKAASSAARWDAETGKASFDWPVIEAVAATAGPNQAMAKLLLAARDEGANSRWPF